MTSRKTIFVSCEPFSDARTCQLSLQSVVLRGIPTKLILEFLLLNSIFCFVGLFGTEKFRTGTENGQSLLDTTGPNNFCTSRKTFENNAD